MMRRVAVFAVVAGALAMLAACSTPSTSQAPVEDRRETLPKPRGVVMDPQTQAVKQPPGFEHAGKPGYYTVKPGETLYRVSLESGQHWKDIQRWNRLDNPDQIQVGQVLRVTPPLEEEGATSSGDHATSAKSAASAVASSSKVAVATTPAVKPRVAQAAELPEPKEDTASHAASSRWLWPADGPVLAGFDEQRNKGLDIGGDAGDAVLASADGRVVYAGAGLRGYGNLIILKHDNTYLTAYAHNRNLLVKEDQLVRRGQKIAEMGNTDADRVKLHFEIRRQGKPVDPAKLLPTR